MPASIRKKRAAPGLVLGLAILAWAGGSPPARAENLSLTLPQAQAMARQALVQKRPRLAYSISKELIEADPRNGHAHYTQALAFAQVDAYGWGLKSARRAFYSAGNDLQKYEAAQLASQLAFLDERLTSSQLWLRRAVQHAPTEGARDETIRAFRTVRARNPLNFNIKLSVTPSDNVNNGSNSPYNIIDGSPLVGTLSPSAQAIPGTVATGDLRLSYRLRQSQTSLTRLTGRFYTRQVRFNNPVAGLSASDLGAARAEAGIAHAFAGRGEDSQWELGLAGGRTWSGGDPYYDFARASVQRRQKLSENLYLSLGTSVEEQLDETVPKSDATQYDAFAQLSYTLPKGGRLGAYVNYRNVDTNGTNRAYSQWTGVVSYTMGQQIGPAVMTFSLGKSVVDYDRYSVLLPVPGGRNDDSVFGGVTASFNDWGYMGFIPTVSFNAGKSRSNISRFDVDETSLSLGVRSEF